MQYSYSFSDELQQEWNWSERYAPQPEILKYANHVADRFKLRPDIQLGTASIGLASMKRQYLVSDHVRRQDRDREICRSRHRLPVECADAGYQGSRGLQGKVYHTGHWPHERWISAACA